MDVVPSPKSQNQEVEPLVRSVNWTVEGAWQNVLSFDMKSTTGLSVTVTVLVMESTHPAYRFISFTEYGPGARKVLTGLICPETVPSPKSQVDDTGGGLELF